MKGFGQPLFSAMFDQLNCTACSPNGGRHLRDESRGTNEQKKLKSFVYCVIWSVLQNREEMCVFYSVHATWSETICPDRW